MAPCATAPSSAPLHRACDRQLAYWYPDGMWPLTRKTSVIIESYALHCRAPLLSTREPPQRCPSVGYAHCTSSQAREDGGRSCIQPDLTMLMLSRLDQGRAVAVTRCARAQERRQRRGAMRACDCDQASLKWPAAFISSSGVRSQDVVPAQFPYPAACSRLQAEARHAFGLLGACPTIAHRDA